MPSSLSGRSFVARIISCALVARIISRAFIAGTVLVTGLPIRAAAADDTAAITPRERIVLFNGKDLSAFYTWLGGPAGNREDPDRVFTVVDHIDGAPAIRISGQHSGGIITKQRYANYRLVAEYRWGAVTWGTRKPPRRISGILLHCQGQDGNYRPDFSGNWMRSIEYEIMDGGTGDFILVGGHEPGRPERIHPSLKATVVPTTKAPRWSPDGTLTEFGAGKGTRIYWQHKDVDATPENGYRGQREVEKPVGEWNVVEAVCDGGNVTLLVNGIKVNEGTDGSFKEGSIEFQSEGSEIFFRGIELHPLKK
jgi:hypothetical protein